MLPKKNATTLSLIALAFCFEISLSTTTLGSQVTVSSAKSLSDATHIELSGPSSWSYDVKRKNVDGIPHIQIQFQKVSPDDLKSLTSIHDKRVKKIEIIQGIDNAALIDMTVSDPRINIFDYQTEKPINLVLDLYKEEIKPKTVVATHKGKLAKKNREAVKEESHTLSPEVAELVKKDARSIASVDAFEIPQNNQPPLLAGQKFRSTSPQNGIFDGGDKDLKRFNLENTDPHQAEIALIRSRQNVYVHFPELITKHSIVDEVFADGRKFEIPESKSEDNQQIRLIIKLYNENKLAVTMTTIKFFNEKFPDSSYKALLGSLLPEIYFKLWKREHNRTDLQQAIALYKEQLNRDRNDPERFRNIMLIGLGYLELDNNFGALSSFQVGVQNYPDSPYYWPMRMAIAEAYRNLNKDDDALKELEKIEQDPKAGEFIAQARYKRGDVYFHKKDYAQATLEYQGAIQKFPADLNEAANCFFNQAEAQFWQHDYKKSLETFRDFLQRFPSNNYGGYAMTRLGEIFDILGENQQKINGAYLEAYFRFHDSPGAYFAKTHINIQRFAGLKPQELEAVLKEITQEKPKDIDDVDAFVTLGLSDGFLTRKEFEKSRDFLIKYYQSNPLSPYLEIFRNRITKNITYEISEHNRSKDYVGALEEYIKNQETWLLKNSRTDTKYFAAEAYEALNVPDDALKLYSQCLGELEKISKDDMKVKSVLENIPSQELLFLRMAKVSEQQNNYQKALEYLGKIKNITFLTDGEQIEKSLLMAEVAQKEERFDLAIKALKLLTEQWKGNPSLLGEPWIKLSQIYKESGDLKTASFYATKVITTFDSKQDGVKENPTVFRQALELSADLNIAEGKVSEAIANLNLEMERFPEENSMGRTRYKLGKIYFDQKNLRDAARIWNPLKSTPGQELWAKMADDKLSNAKWSLKYDRYFNKDQRQPAGVKQ